MATKSLFEAYKNRLSVADTVYGKMHNGERMTNNRKLVTAKCLENLNRFMNEAFDQSVGTQRSDMQGFKKFALNLTTVALPNLISHDLVIVHPMSSMSGYVTYIEYQYASNKGTTKQGDLISSPFGFGNVDANYTGARVVEEFTGTTGTASWFPVFTYTGTDPEQLKAVPRITAIVTAAGVAVDVAEDAAVTVGEDGKTLTLSNGTGTAIQPTDKVKVAYVYDNVVIPQNDLPMIKAEMKSVALVAKARRIAVYYSQLAAYQARTDYGVDLGDQLAEKAVGELSYRKLVA